MLGDDPDAFIFTVNQWDTIALNRVAAASHWRFDDDPVMMIGAKGSNCKGVCRLRSLKGGGYAVESFLAGKPSWEDVCALMAIEVRERLSPAARLIPFSNPFESQPELPVVPWQMGAYLTNEKAPADTPFRQGGDPRVLRFIFDYKQPDGSPAVGWVGADGVACHVHNPSVLADTNGKVQHPHTLTPTHRHSTRTLAATPNPKLALSRPVAADNPSGREA